jgi:hypothetical protein
MECCTFYTVYDEDDLNFQCQKSYHTTNLNDLFVLGRHTKNILTFQGSIWQLKFVHEIPILTVKLFDFNWLFTVLCLAQEFFTYIAGEGLQNLGLCSALRAFERHHCRWRAAKFRPMLGAQGLYRATPAVTRDLGFSGLIRRTAQCIRLLRHTRGCGGNILTRILTGCLILGYFCITVAKAKMYFNIHIIDSTIRGKNQNIQNYT